MLVASTKDSMAVVEVFASMSSSMVARFSFVSRIFVRESSNCWAECLSMNLTTMRLPYHLSTTYAEPEAKKSTAVSCCRALLFPSS
jgi:hypothetical protein